MTKSKAEIVGEAYSRDFWANCPYVYRDLVQKDQDRTHPVSNEQSNHIFRAVLTFDHLREHLPDGASIIDMGCGLGFNTCHLTRMGYRVRAFDVSETGVEHSRELARQMGLDPAAFTHSDHTYLREVLDASVDAVIGMGFIYYLDDEARDETYRHFGRILNPGGIAALTLTNMFFDAFALNDTSLRFWALLIGGYSDAASLLPGSGVLAALEGKISVPGRRRLKKSISQRYQIHVDNPLVYGQLVRRYGLEVEEILYPDNHLLPPFLEDQADPEALMMMKAETCVQKARDWQGMFMDYEFLAFMRKPEG